MSLASSSANQTPTPSCQWEPRVRLDMQMPLSSAFREC